VLIECFEAVVITTGQYHTEKMGRAARGANHAQPYIVIVKFVYPVLVIAGQPNVFGRNVMEKGEHVKLGRVKPNGVTRRFEQYCCEPAGHEPVVPEPDRCGARGGPAPRPGRHYARRGPSSGEVALMGPNHNCPANSFGI
jgi:hypothetical protein